MHLAKRGVCQNRPSPRGPEALLWMEGRTRWLGHIRCGTSMRELTLASVWRSSGSSRCYKNTGCARTRWKTAEQGGRGHGTSRLDAGAGFPGSGSFGGDPRKRCEGVGEGRPNAAWALYRVHLWAPGPKPPGELWETGGPRLHRGVGEQGYLSPALPTPICSWLSAALGAGSPGVGAGGGGQVQFSACPRAASAVSPPRAETRWRPLPWYGVNVE